MLTFRNVKHFTDIYKCKIIKNNSVCYMWLCVYVHFSVHIYFQQCFLKVKVATSTAARFLCQCHQYNMECEIMFPYVTKGPYSVNLWHLQVLRRKPVMVCGLYQHSENDIFRASGSKGNTGVNTCFYLGTMWESTSKS